MELNPDQQKAVFQNDCNQLIIAGPGTGKTHTLTQKISHLLSQGKDPTKIIALTFTIKAAEEMRQRLNQPSRLVDGEGWGTSGVGQPGRLICGTFHSLAIKILKQNQQKIRLLNPADHEKIINEIASSKKLLQKQKKELKRIISLAKNQLIPFEEIETFLDFELLQNLYDKYAQKLEQSGYMDFDDLIINASENLLPSTYDPPEYLFIDEYQDISKAQFKLIKKIASPETKIIAIGDPDQSIYSFRGSNHKFFLDFKKDFSPVEVINLKTNYRSNPTIIKTAKSLIQNNKNRIESELVSSKNDQTEITLHPFENEWDEAKFITKAVSSLIGGTDMIQAHDNNLIASANENRIIKPSDIAVLYRTKNVSRPLIDMFNRQNIPYQCVSKTPWYQKSEITFLIECLASLIDPEKQSQISNEQKLLIENFSRTHAGLHIQKTSDALKSFMDHIKIIPHFETAETLSGSKKINNLQRFLAQSVMFNNKTGISGLQDMINHYAILKQEDTYNPSLEAASLMTLHAAKGLEFKVVFICAVEEDILPHTKSMPDNIEEERRLFYVGITRAKQNLFLSYAFNRNQKSSAPSRFIKEIKETVSIQALPQKRKKLDAKDQMALF